MSQFAFRPSVLVLLPRTIPELIGTEDVGLLSHFCGTLKDARRRGPFHSADAGLAYAYGWGKVCDAGMVE